MNDTKELLKIIESYLIGYDSLPMKIRQMEEVCESDFNKLKDAIIEITKYYENKSEVPKQLDISNFFFVPNLNYSEEELERYEDYGIELSELANKIFS